jgi:hypothetical protein
MLIARTRIAANLPINTISLAQALVILAEHMAGSLVCCLLHIEVARVTSEAIPFKCITACAEH